jgi:DNA repair exonuclease SbcCD ATPase subunit
MLPWKHGIKKEQLHRFNQLFMMAEQVLKDETCSTCGTPFWLSHSSDSSIEFHMEEDTCEACAELQRQEEEKAKNKEEAGPGVTRYVTAHSAFEEEGGVLPGRREWIAEQQAEYLKQQMKKARESGDGG